MAAGRQAARRRAAKAHDGLVLPGDLEGSNPFLILLAAMSQS